MPLRDKVRLSESSISKTPTAFLWGQILQPCCIFLASSGAAFNMYGGAIAGNMAKRDITTDGYSKDAATYGGGVYVGGGKTFNMHGGTIAGNTATRNGGVYVGSNATFTMTGGTIGGSTTSSMTIFRAKFKLSPRRSFKGVRGDDKNQK